MNQLQFLRALVVFNGLIPLVMLSWDAYRGHLGVNSVNNALHITGILSLVFLFLSLLMSPLKWATGWGGWIAFRRALGLYGFFYSVVHLVIYVCFDRALSLSSTLSEIWMRQFLQVGALAILLMIPLAVTSTNGMIQRMGPKRWKLLHRSAYAVAVLGVLHYYMLVKSDVRQPLAFAGVLTALLGGRFGRHYYELQQATKKKAVGSVSAISVRMKPVAEEPKQTLALNMETRTPPAQWKGELLVAAIVQETSDVKTFRLMTSDGRPLPFEYLPGQFINIQLTIDDKRVNRSYTLASSPTRRESCELTIKREPMGTASRFIHDHLEVGHTVKISGPSGRFTFTGHESTSVLLIAGGVGITPLMSMTRYLIDRAWSGDIYFLIVAKTEQDLIFHEELQLLQERFPQLHVCITLTRCDASSTWTEARGRANGPLLQRFVPNITSVSVYLCGPNEMMDATRELLREIGVPESLVKTEAFAGKKSAITPSSEAVDLAELPENIALAKGKMNSTMKAKVVSTVSFSRSNVQTEIPDDVTILEIAEASAVAIPFECRSGFCGQCKTLLLEGSVQMDCEDALSSAEKADGWILACQAKPKSKVVIEA